MKSNYFCVYTTAESGAKIWPVNSPDGFGSVCSKAVVMLLFIYFFYFYLVLPTINYLLILGGAVGEQLENDENGVC